MFTINFLGHETRNVWVLGSSIVKRAFLHSRTRPGGVTLGLDKVNFWWQGYSGLGLKSLKHKLGTLQKVWDGPKPDFILVHCGANDLGKLKVYSILRVIDDVMKFFKEHFPQSRIIWSQLLPRKNWRYSKHVIAMENARKRINRYGATKVLESNGCYLLHPDLAIFNETLFDNDGVHLSTLGNDLFLNQLRAGIDTFMADPSTHVHK